MKRPISDIAFTPSVKLAQQQRGSRDIYQRMEQRGGWQYEVMSDLAAFINNRSCPGKGDRCRECEICEFEHR